MAYVKIIYQNSPSTATPINAQNLNHMDDGIAENDRRLNELETAGVVNKFNGRSGNITPTKGDYDIADIGATDGQDGYVPVWRNSGTEEDPNWGFEMEAQGGAGHVLVDSDGNNMPSEDKMQFADAFLTDDDVNGKTVVENIKEVAPADYASTTDEGIIVCDDGEDAVIHPSSDDKVEVTADGVKNIRQLLDELFALCDTSKISRDSVIVKANEVYAFQRPFASGYMFVTLYGNTSSSELDTIIFNSSNSRYLEWSYKTSGNTITELSTTQVLSDGTKVTLYYGNKKAVVDLQTTANRCLMSDGVTVQSRLDKSNAILTTIPSSVTTVADAISNIYSQLSALNIAELLPINYSVLWTGHDRYYGEAILFSNSAHLTLIGYNSMYICDVDNGTVSYKTVSVN